MCWSIVEKKDKWGIYKGIDLGEDVCKDIPSYWLAELQLGTDGKAQS